MRIRELLPFGILLCVMFIVGIACNTSEPPASPVQYSEAQNLQDMTKCAYPGAVPESSLLDLEKIVEGQRNELKKLKDLKSDYERAVAAFELINAYQQDLASQMASQEVDEETQAASVIVRVELITTFEDIERLSGIPGPPGTSSNEIVSVPWYALGTLVNTGKFGNKIIVARHAFYGFLKEDRNALESLTISISIFERQLKAQHAISLAEFREFPELDLVALDAPSSLKVKALFLGNVNSYKTSLVSQIYPSAEGGIYSQLVQIAPFPDGTVFNPPVRWINIADNFMRVSGRVISGDSGGPLVLKENGERKVVGFIQGKFLEKSGGGVAIKAGRLLDEFAKLESQRP